MADFEKKLGFTAGGAEPTTDIKTKGFQAGYKPPATFFNWLFTRTSDCINELQDYCSKRKIKGYTSFEQIGLTVGSETIKEIATNLPDDSLFFTFIDSSNADIYPKSHSSRLNGFLLVTKKDSSHIIFEFYEKWNYDIHKWYGYYDLPKINLNWTGWIKTVTEKELSEHTNDKNNPHEVTAEQLGIDLTDLENHLVNYNNPHGVTKTQIGLSNVPNKATHYATYYAFGQIGLVGSEATIESIVEALPTSSELIVFMGSTDNTDDICPKINGNEIVLGILRATKTDIRGYVTFQYHCYWNQVAYTFIGEYDNDLAKKWSGWYQIAPSNCLPLTGGTITGAFTVKNNPIKITNDVTTTEITGLVNPVAEGHHFLDINLFGQYASGTLRMSVEDAGKLVDPNDMLQMKMAEINGGTYWYKVYHEGNKPHGSYTGNNAIREIDIGGKSVGRGVLIWTDGFVTLITPEGGFTMGTKNTINDGSYDKGEVMYEYWTGKLKINRTYSSATEPDRLSGINKPDVTYSYQVI